MIELTLYQKPVPLNQKFFVRNGRNILSSKYRDAKTALQLEIATQCDFEPLGRNVAVTIRQYYGDKRKRDVDSWVKILLDAMSEIVYIDDVQVTELHCYKEVDKENPRVVIQVV